MQAQMRTGITLRFRRKKKNIEQTDDKQAKDQRFWSFTAMFL